MTLGLKTHSCETVGKVVCIGRADTRRNCSTCTITQYQSGTCNFRAFLIELLTLGLKLGLTAGIFSRT